MYGQSMMVKYGEFFKVWLGTELNIILTDPNDVEVSSTAAFGNWENFDAV